MKTRIEALCEMAMLDDYVDLKHFARQRYAADPLEAAIYAADARALRRLIRAEIAKANAPAPTEPRSGRAVVGSDMLASDKPWCRECESIYWHKDGCSVAASTGHLAVHR